MTSRRILLADDDDTVLQQASEQDGFEAVPASCVTQARCIAVQEFGVLLSHLHMPNAEDGFTVAMHHTHPHAVTPILSGYPALEEAMSAVSLHADEVLVKPNRLDFLGNVSPGRLALRKVRRFPAAKSVASVGIFTTIQRNPRSVAFSRVLLDVVTIADECDSQLKQAMLSYAVLAPALGPRVDATRRNPGGVVIAPELTSCARNPETYRVGVELG